MSKLFARDCTYSVRAQGDLRPSIVRHTIMATLLSSPALAPTRPRRLDASRLLSQPSLHHVRKSPSVVQLSPLQEIPFLLDVSPVAENVAVGGSSGVSYSPASYYTSLGLFVISVPGLWSLIKRSVKSKIVQKTFVKDGSAEAATAAAAAAAPNQVAGEILSFFARNNFTVSERGETITFEGMMVPSRGQAALLTFCTCISLASVGLVLSIAIPEGGNNWFWLMLLSPLAGVYYWQRASRKEEIKVRMLVGNEGNLSEIIVRGDDQQVEQMRKELQLSEKGMIYVKGIFEQ